MNPEQLFVPQDPQTYVLRPLTKGLQRELHPSEVGESGVYDLKNYMVRRDGLKRSPGTTLYGAAGDTDDVPYLDIAVFWQTTGVQKPCLLTSRFFYTLNAYSAPSAIGWDYTTGTALCVGGTAVAGSGTDWDATNHCLGRSDSAATGTDSHNDKGDWIAFNSDSYATWYEIASITNGSSLTLATNGPVTGGYVNYKLRRCFHPDENHLLDWTVCPDANPMTEYRLYVTDYERQPMVYDSEGGTLALATQEDENSPPNSLDFVCGCLCWFSERLWMGNIIEDGTDHYQHRIWWSDVGDPETFTTTNFIDLPYTSSEILRIIPLGSLLAVYFKDCIYLGRPTTDPDLPYAFFRAETGGVGLAGPRAVCEVLRGHVFLGKDDVYILNYEGIRPMNAPDELIDNCTKKQNAYCVVDPERNRIVIGAPESGDAFAYLWSYNFKTDAWSRDTSSGFTFLASPVFQGDYTWNDLTTSPGILSADNWSVGMAAIPSWAALADPQDIRTVFTGDGLAQTHQFVDDAPGINGEAFSQVIETGDLDFKQPEMDKSFTETRVRLRDRTATAISLTVEYSDDSGATWTTLGVLTIAANTREGKLNFRRTGSAVRFRFTTQTTVAEYTVVEISFRVLMRGVDVELD